MEKDTIRPWAIRILVGLVTGWNLQAALLFIVKPEAYVSGFELGGLPGETALRGVGVLFLMWIVPYFVAIWNPIRYRLALNIALAMQLIGVIGEAWILLGLPADHATLLTSLLRFIAFDGFGVLLLALAAGLARPGAGIHQAEHRE